MVSLLRRFPSHSARHRRAMPAPIRQIRRIMETRSATRVSFLNALLPARHMALDLCKLHRAKEGTCLSSLDIGSDFYNSKPGHSIGGILFQFALRNHSGRGAADHTSQRAQNTSCFRCSLNPVRVVVRGSWPAIWPGKRLRNCLSTRGPKKLVLAHWTMYERAFEHVAVFNGQQPRA